MRTLLLSTCLALSMAVSADALARTSSVDARFAERGLGGNAACLAFVDAQAVEHRKDRWLQAIEEIWHDDPQFVLDWIIGAVDPPRSVREEATKQRDCLFGMLVHDAADPQTRLIVDYQKANASKEQMAALGARYRRSAAFRRQFHATLTESEHRDAHTQSWIWKRKFVFSGRNFNFVSERAAERCGLDPLQSWKPDHDRHRDCWRRTLTPAEREREILGASAAPGISRHHWGTDFDFFSLNPQMFRTGRYADEYLWMTHNALTLGFFQPYSKREAHGEHYMEERWHWSYYPIAQALLEFAASRSTEVGAALDEQWKSFESRWNRRDQNRPFFGFVRAHWKEFMFNVDDHAISNPEPR